jgi:hypothetical protein
LRKVFRSRREAGSMIADVSDWAGRVIFIDQR